MATKIEELEIIISASTEALGKELLAVNKKLDTFGKQVERVSPKISLIDKFTSSLFEMGKVAGGIVIANSFGKLSSQMGSFINSMVEGAGNAQQTALSFEVMLGSVEKSKKLLKEISDFAYVTPFQLTEVQEMSKRLLAYGVAQDDIIPTMRTLGNISSAVGKDKLPQLITAFGQIRAKGRLMGQELLQLSETGLPMREALVDIYNATNKAQIKMSDFDKVMEKGGFTFNMVQKALESYGGASGKWGNLMERQSKTFGGMTSNVEDLRGKIFALIGGVDQSSGELIKGGLLDVLSEQIQNALFWVGENQDAIMEFSKTMSKYFGEGIKVAKDLAVNGFKFLRDKIKETKKLFDDISKWVTENKPTIELITTAFVSLAGAIALVTTAIKVWTVVTQAHLIWQNLLNASMGVFAGLMAFITSPVTIAVAAIAGLGFAALMIFQQWDNLVYFWQNTVAPAISWVGGRMSEGFSVMVSFIVGLFKGMLDTIGGFFNTIGGWITSTLEGLGLIEKKETSFNKGFFSKITRSVEIGVNKVGKNAEGTDYWKGGLTWVGERGPELVNLPRGSQVIPNDKATSMNKTANITNNFYNTEVDTNMLASRLNFQLNMI